MLALKRERFFQRVTFAVLAVFCLSLAPSGLWAGPLKKNRGVRAGVLDGSAAEIVEIGDESSTILVHDDELGTHLVTLTMTPDGRGLGLGRLVAALDGDRALEIDVERARIRWLQGRNTLEPSQVEICEAIRLVAVVVALLYQVTGNENLLAVLNVLNFLQNICEAFKEQL